MKEQQRYSASGLNRTRSGVEARKKMKAAFNKVGYQIKKVTKGKNSEGYYSDDHNQDPAIIEYSLSRFQKVQKKDIRNQERDDNELVHPSEDDDSRSNDEWKEVPDEPSEHEETFFDPLSWVRTMTSQGFDVQEEEMDDDREEVEAEEDEGYSADQERERHANHHEDQENEIVQKKRWRKQKKSPKATVENAAHETESTIARSGQMPATEVLIVPLRSSAKSSRKISDLSIRRSASRSSKAIVYGAKRVSQMPINLVRTSSKLIVSNAKKVTLSIKKKSTSKRLTRSIKLMNNVNQEKAASELLVQVQKMIQKSDQYQTPGLLLQSIQTLIRDSEIKAANSHRIACQEQRRNYRQSETIELNTKHDEKKEKDSDESVQSDDRTYSDDESEDSAITITYRYVKGVINEVDGEEDYSEDNYAIDTDWDDRTRNSETTAYTTDFGNFDDSADFDKESDIEIEGITMYNDFASDEVFLEEEESQTEHDSSDDFNNAKSSIVGYADTDIAAEEEQDDFDDTVSCLLTPEDQAILDGIEHNLEILENMHENEKEGWLFRTFRPED